MSDRLLKSWTGAPLIVDRRNSEPPSQENLAASPGTVNAQEPICDMDRDFDSETSQRFVLHAICPPTRFVRRRCGYPLGKLSGLQSRKLPARPFECDFESAPCTALDPAIQSSWAYVGEARIFRPQIVARFVLNRCAARTIIARETAHSLANHDPPAFAARIGQRVIFADAARSGQLVFEQDDNGFAAREIAALAAEIERLAP